MITGKHIIELGYKPAKWFGVVLDLANNHYKNTKEIYDPLYMRWLIETELAKQPKIIEPFESPISYFKNIDSNSIDEKSNIISVEETMEILMKTPTIISGAIMPDACPTGEKGQIPVGAVVITRNAIHPSMHSADICCSVTATNFGKIDPKKVLDSAHSITHFGFGGRKDCFGIPKVLEDKIKNNSFLNDQKSIEYAKTHLGTQGDGNHFLFVGVSENTRDIYMVTHHGSRGFGAYLYKKGMRLAEKFRKKLSPNTIVRNAWIPYDTKEGKEYWEALQIVREWTKLNHDVIHNKTSELVGGYKDRFWNEHNFVFKDGDKFYHAKGATPLDDKFVPDSKNGLRLIPLNMAEPVLVVRGETTSNNLGFAPHGAGRNISRTTHKKRKDVYIDEDVFFEETIGLDIRFFSEKIDVSELPSAYKNASDLQKQMEKYHLGNIVDRIMPYGCIMAGESTFKYPWLNKNSK